MSLRAATYPSCGYWKSLNTVCGLAFILIAQGDWPWERWLEPLQWLIKCCWPQVEWLVVGDDLKRNCPWKVWQGLCAGVSGVGKCCGGCDGQAKGYWGGGSRILRVLRVHHEWKVQQAKRCTGKLTFRKKTQQRGRRGEGQFFGNCSLGLASIEPKFPVSSEMYPEART